MDTPRLEVHPVARRSLGRRTTWARHLSSAWVTFLFLAATGCLADVPADVQRRLEELRAAGKPLTGADLASPPVTEEENAAPLYLRAADLIKARNFPPSSGGGPGALTAPGAGGTPSAPVEVEVSYSDMDWGNAERLAKLADLLAQDQEALDLVRQATERPQCRFDTPHDNLAGPYASAYAPLRSLVRFEGVAARVASHEGEPAEALEHVRRALVISRRLCEDRTYLAWLTSLACDQLVFRAGEYVLSQGTPPEEAARALLEELTRLDPQQAMVQGVQALRVEGLQTFDRVRQLCASDAPSAPASKDEAIQAFLTRYAGAEGGAALARDELAFLALIDRVEEAVGTPYPQAKPLMDAIEADPEYVSLSNLVTRTYAQSLPFPKVGMGSAHRQLLIGGLGLSAYRSARGAHAGTLAELTDIGWPVPTDPFTLQPLVYGRTEGGFLLYSFGRDLDDDGGRHVYWQDHDPAKRQSGQQRAAGARQVEDGDLVWQPWPQAARAGAGLWRWPGGAALAQLPRRTPVLGAVAALGVVVLGGGVWMLVRRRRAASVRTAARRA